MAATTLQRLAAVHIRHGDDEEHNRNAGEYKVAHEIGSCIPRQFLRRAGLQNRVWQPQA